VDRRPKLFEFWPGSFEEVKDSLNLPGTEGGFMGRPATRIANIKTDIFQFLNSKIFKK
jgi:hypothetical protein